jgi:hypothetical protein
MIKIPTDRFKPKPGTMHAYLFENPYAGIEPRLFYDIAIPLEPFDSGLDDEEQPVETLFSLNFITFPVTDWRKFDGQSFEMAQGDADGSIYLGSRHNPVDINLIRFTRLDGFLFRVKCSLSCNFEFERVAENATIELRTDVEFKGMVVGLGSKEYAREDILKAKEIASSQGNRQVRKYLKAIEKCNAKERALEISSRLVDLRCYAEPQVEAGRIVFKPKDEEAP